MVKLNKDLYGVDLIKQAAERQPEEIISVGSDSNYHLVQLNTKNSEDRLDFLNYLIYLRRSR